LTELLRRWGNNDKHLEVGFVGAPLQLSRQEDALPATGSAPLPGCFVEAEKGEDEIGYLKLNSFESVVASAHASESEKFEARQNKRTLEDALTKLAGARSVIIDLRENGGGDPRSGAGSNCR
jgi:C-terminal processing protease CtpA/Prc